MIVRLRAASLALAAIVVLAPGICAAQEESAPPADGAEATPAPAAGGPAPAPAADVPERPILSAADRARSPRREIPVFGVSPSQVFKVGGALCAVLAVIGLLAFGLRRMVPGMRAGGGRLPGLEVVGRIPVGPRQALLLARVGRRILVVGVTPDGMSTLCQIEDPAEVERVMLGDAGSGAPGGGFARWMSEASSPDAAVPSEGEVPVAAAQDRLRRELAALRARLGGLRGAAGDDRAR